MPDGAGQVSSYQAQLWVAQLLAIPLYAALASADPFIGSPLAAEVIGGSYGRPLLPFVAAGPTAIQSSTAAAWHGLAPGTVIFGVMIFDAPRNGNMRAAFAYDAPVDLINGGKYTVSSGEIEIGIDIAVI